MRLTDLRHKQVRTLDGKRLGRIFEVHCDGGEVAALMCGPGSLLERLTTRSRGTRLPWNSVKRIDATAVVVAADPKL